MNRSEARAYLIGLLLCGLFALHDGVALDIAAVLAIALIGTPHGAADALRLLAAARGRDGIRWGRFAALNALYLAIAAAVWWLVLRWPAAALAIFVAISGLHFAATDIAAERARGDGRGAAVTGWVAIAAPFVLWQSQIVPWLTWLGLTPAQATAFSPALAGGVVIAALGWALGRTLPARRLPTALWVAVPSVLLPPAAGFARYFCAVHAVRHWAHLRVEGRPLPWRPVALTMVATLALAGGLLWMHEDGALAPRLVQVVVIGLAALTVPHMLLDAWARRAAKGR
jgi:Brp/Blh family beta-carotene 15,15'-monooxygenase